jgi:predicted flap endonuclease-1-like 5' DNA nuclease
MLELVLPKNYINIIAGVVNMVFEKLDSVEITVPTPKVTVEVAEDIVEKSPAKSAVKLDDLTVINGIGPTFAKRLQAAGITTYQDLAEASPEHIKEVAKLADWQADPADWIAGAKELA